jgi:Flp pilus assembly protein TadG
MSATHVLPRSLHGMLSFVFLKIVQSSNRGQALVEFTLIFMLLLVIAWIPTDFGLAFFTGQLALNASREGARIAAATKPFNATDVATETCKRLSWALLRDPGGGGTPCLPYSNAKVTVTAPTGATCNQQVTVTVSGNYNYSLFGILQFFVSSVPSSVTITRSTQMRWEGQQMCN